MTPHPKTLYIGTGTLCGYQCIYCNNPRMENKQTLGIEVIRHLLSEFPEATTVDIGGYGEFLLHPECEGIIAMLSERKIPFCFSTNGQMLTTEKQALLRASSLRVINFSLNTFDHELHRFLSGGVSDFTQVLEQFKAFIKRPRSYRVNVSMVVNRYNYKEMPSFVSAVGHYGADGVRLSGPVREIPYPEGFALLDDAEEKRYLVWAREVGESLHLEMSGMLSGQLAGGEKPLSRAPISRCVAPWVMTCINENGTVTPCCYGSSYPVGNINVEPFREIWDGEKMKTLRATIKQGFNHLCKNCMDFE